MYEELNGTMDKTYPIKEDVMTDDKIEINTGIAGTVYNVPDPDGGLNTSNGYILDEDTINIGSHLPGAASDDVITFGGEDHISFDGNVDLSDYTAGYGSTALYDTLTLNIPDEFKLTPGIEDQTIRKYKEDESIKALQDYISTTYGGHYTSENNNVQTLDLIESVGDAEAFCRSNAIKYLSRYDKKGQAKRDILKALHYSLLLYHFSGQLNETTTRGYETF